MTKIPFILILLTLSGSWRGGEYCSKLLAGSPAKTRRAILFLNMYIVYIFDFKENKIVIWTLIDLLRRMLKRVQIYLNLVTDIIFQIEKMLVHFDQYVIFCSILTIFDQLFYIACDHAQVAWFQMFEWGLQSRVFFAIDPMWTLMIVFLFDIP